MLKLLIAKFFGLFDTLKEILSAIRRDLFGLWLVFKIESRLKRIEQSQIVLDDIFEGWVRSQPNKPCIIFNEQIWTFKDLRDYSNKITNLFASKFKLKKGDCVCLFMENKPEYVGIWLGLSKLGVISALVNTNLKNQQLMHTFENAKPKLVIYSAELEQAIKTVKTELNGSLKVMSENELSDLVSQTSDDIFVPTEKILPQDVIMYIYTSGTTGLPKPAVIKQNRYCAGGFTFFESSGLDRKRDIVYVTLPIYHANGAIIGVGAAIVSGATVVLRKKFSASNFWSECIRHGCTAFIYVGEICRYLVNQPDSPIDREHRVRIAIGNGLRENVWRDFKNRFGVKCVEFYAASEGNCTLVNITSKTGACGFVPLVNSLVPVLPTKLIRIDNAMNPIRDEKGFCVETRPGEKGLLVGIIGKSTKTAFNGYANNSQASNKKVIEDLFKKGQRAFNSGDLMMKDWLGYMYFCDRLGDTFRWRGENVATIEVENILSKHLRAAEVCVYGVELPEQEGRCGMAAIAKTDLGDLDALTAHILAELPAYARPLFIRVVDHIDHTGTFKAKKTLLVEQAYNVNLFPDTVYYFSVRDQAYKLLTPVVYLDIQNRNYAF